MCVTIVIPARNEGAALRELLPRLKAMNCADEIIVVNDGSDDDTATVCAMEGIRLISHPYPMGNGAAVKTGARVAVGDVIVFMDGDGQHSPDDVARLLARLEEGYDMVVGARQAGSQASFGRGLANRLYNRLASYMTNQRVSDLTSGLRAVRAAKFREFIHLLPNGFSYPTTITMAFFRAGYTVSYLPIHAARREGRSHLHPLKDGIRFLLIIFKVGTLYSPLKLYLPLAAAVFFLASAYYGYTFLVYGRFTNMSALLYTTSLLIFLMGLVSEQITQLYYKDSERR